MSYYTREEYERIAAIAEETGFTQSGFQKYCTLLFLNKNNKEKSADIIELIKDAKTAALKIEPDHSFIASSLLPQSIWAKLSKGDKHAISNAISNLVKKNPDKFKVEKRKGEVNKYIRIDNKEYEDEDNESEDVYDEDDILETMFPNAEDDDELNYEIDCYTNN